jgi:dethiobiotin synthetase
MSALKGRILFITGTDTGVGKTLLTASMLHFLRSRGVHALAMKPFCSGERSDAEILAQLQENELTLDEINPYFFDEPVAPLAARRKSRSITLDGVTKRVLSLARRAEILLVEGCGGVCVPLGGQFLVLDLIAALKCEVVVAAANRLGVLNHSILTVRALSDSGLRNVHLVLMGRAEADPSVRTNEALLNRLLLETNVFSLPYLGSQASEPKHVVENIKKIEKVLERILGMNTFSHAFRGTADRRGVKSGVKGPAKKS